MQKSGACHYLISDIESLSHQIQRKTDADLFHAPILAGAGMGGGLALDLVTQTPNATIGSTVIVDPSNSVPLDRPLCTSAAYTKSSKGEVYALPSGVLVDPVTVLLTPAAETDARARALAFGATSSNATITSATDTVGETLAAALAVEVAKVTSTARTLPVQVLAATPSHGTMAIILSGDGGWRDLDKSIGDIFQASGIPTVGLDSLHYFWTKRTPEQTARDLEAIVAQYSTVWNTPDVLLVGYSFGADVLPETYLALGPATRARVRQISLLGLSPKSDWEITVSGWLAGPSSNARPTGPPLAKIPAGLIQCVYGILETDSPCPGLATKGAETIQTQGGHHFDGNYPAIAQKIIASLDKRRAEGVSK